MILLALPIFFGQQPYSYFDYFGTMTHTHGVFVMSCKSQSMFPTFTCTDDLIIVPSNNNITLEDIVIASSGRGDYVVHRVVGIHNGTYTLRGDNNTRDDPRVYEPRHIRWKVAGIWLRNVSYETGLIIENQKKLFKTLTENVVIS